MRSTIILLMLTAFAAAQVASPTAPASATAPSTAAQLEIPAGTKVPLALKNAISTKTTREGDPVYAETVFPVVVNERVVIPAGTYVQGRITSSKRAGRVKGRAEVLMHFTTLIYPSGYTVVLPGALDSVPGADKTSMKGDEGTIRQDSQTAEKIGTVAGPTATGATVGAITGGGKGALIGGAAGGAVGTAIALLSRGTDVRLETGTTVEMVIQRPVTLDAARIPPAMR
jgi:type F conjugative transfer system protein TrbI